MYAELKTENWTIVEAVIREQKESAEPVQITLNKSGGIFRLELVCKREPDGPTNPCDGARRRSKPSVL